MERQSRSGCVLTIASRVGGTGAANPDGDPNHSDPNAILPTVPVGALVGSVVSPSESPSASSAWFLVGSSATVTTTTAGELFLIYNDVPGEFYDNGGSYSVAIDVTFPPAEPVPPPGSDPFIPPTPTDRTFFDTRFAGCCSFDVETSDPSLTITYGPSDLPNLTCTNVDNPGTTDGAPHSLVRCEAHPGQQSSSYLPQVEFDARSPSGTIAGTRTYRLGNGIYLAMGDSFSAGEGAHDYEPPTASGSNKCHRSRNAYPRAVERFLTPGITDFVACSGARIDDLGLKPSESQCGTTLFGKQPCESGEDPQIQQINSYDSVVTLGVGGNDAGFADIVTTCIIGALKKQSGVGVILGAIGIEFGGGDCAGQDQSRNVNATIAQIKMRLIALYRVIQQQAPLARILVIDYPREFPRNGSADNGLGKHLCLGLPKTDQLWLNDLANRIDLALEQATVESGVAELVQVRDAFEGHDQCSAHPWANALVNGGKSPESVHPNAEGQRAFANAMLTQLQRPPQRQVFDVLPNEVDEATDTVPPDASAWSVRDRWPGSTVSMTLVAPSGRTYDAATPGVQHVAGPTFEAFTIRRPEPGTWKVRLHGDAVSASGETVTLQTASVQTSIKPRASAAPRASLTHGLLRFTVKCKRADYACSGTYRVALPRRGRHDRSRTVVRSGFAILSRHTGTVSARLNRHARRALGARGRRRVKLELTLDGAAGGRAGHTTTNATLVVR